MMQNINNSIRFKNADYDLQNDRIIITSKNSIFSYIYFDKNGNFEIMSEDAEYKTLLQLLLDNSGYLIKKDIYNDYETPEDICAMLNEIFSVFCDISIELYNQNNSTVLSFAININHDCVGNYNFDFETQDSEIDVNLVALKSFFDNCIENNKSETKNTRVDCFLTCYNIAKKENFSDFSVII